VHQHVDPAVLGDDRRDRGVDRLFRADVQVEASKIGTLFLGERGNIRDRLGVFPVISRIYA
jgi:hypothetical protein